MNYIYFDFDGTLADSVMLGIEIANSIAPKYGFKTVDISKKDYYRTLSAQEILKEFHIPLILLPIIGPVFKIELNKRIDQLLPFEGIDIILKELSKKYTLGILTSNSRENVSKFLKKHNLFSYISDIKSEFHIFGKHNSLRKIITKKNIPKQNFIYVGDETRDIEATKRLKLASIAVTWGVNNETLMKKFKPDFIAYSPTDIIAFADVFFAQKQ